MRVGEYQTSKDRLSDPERVAFIRAIADAPDDDTPRVAFADWLEERGEPERAALIRAQWRYELLPRDHPGRAELRQEISGLTRRYGRRWVAELGRRLEGWDVGDGWDAEGEPSWAFRRGFIEGLSLTGAVFLNRGEELFHRTPLRALRLTQIRKYVYRVLAAPELGRLSYLALPGNRITDYEAVYLTRSIRPGKLARLDVSDNRIGRESALRLVEWLAGRGPVGVQFSRNAIGEDGAEALAASPALAFHRALLVAGNYLGDVGASALFRSPHAGGLSQIDMSANWVGPNGVTALAGRGWTNLSHLALVRNDLGNAGARILARTTNLVELQHLDVSGNQIGDSGARALARSTALRRLTHLNLRDNRIGDAGARAFLDCALPELMVVDLSDNPISPSVAAELDAFTRQTGRMSFLLPYELADLDS